MADENVIIKTASPSLMETLKSVSDKLSEMETVKSVSSAVDLQPYENIGKNN